MYRVFTSIEMGFVGTLAVPALKTAPSIAPKIDLSFPHAWQAEVLAARPLILPARHFVYPAKRKRWSAARSKCWFGPQQRSHFWRPARWDFAIPRAHRRMVRSPTREICAVSGGYAYLIDTSAPERFTMLPYRPVLQFWRCMRGLLLFVGNRRILAWGAKARRGNRRSSPTKA